MSEAYLLQNADHLSTNFTEQDFAAIQMALDDNENGEEIDANAIHEGSDEFNLSYDAMLRLGEQIGDVKEERWAMIAQEYIQNLPLVKYSMEQEGIKNDSSHQCLICQFHYEKGDRLRELPCGHRFHAECVDQWLKKKDICPYCRKSIVE